MSARMIVGSVRVVAAIVAASCVPSPPVAPAACAAIAADGDEQVVVVPDTEGGAFLAPKALVQGDRVFLFATRRGDGNIGPLMRFESTDGVDFSNRLELADSRRHIGEAGVGNVDVLVVDGRWRMYFHTRVEGVFSSARNRIELATSDDGVTWDWRGPAFVPPEVDPAIDTVVTPRVWHDGRRFHLYYTANQLVCGGDVCDQRSRIEHATSDDGESFTRQGPLFESACAESSVELWLLLDVVRPACEADCALDGVALLALHAPCAGGPSGARLLTSGDGFDFAASGTVLVGTAGPPEVHGSGLVDGDDLFRYVVGEDGTIRLRRESRPADLSRCE